MGSYNLPTSGKHPSHALLVAVVVQAVDDLDSPYPVVKYEANRFFREPVGGWAEMRRFYFGALGLDEGKALAAIEHRFSDVEPPTTYFDASVDDVLALLPRESFTAVQVAEILGVRYNKASSHFQVLMRHGKIKRFARGLFARHDYVLPEPLPVSVKRNPSEVRRIVHGLLRERPRKFKDLVMATEGDVPEGAIRTVLRNGLETGELKRSWAAEYSHSTPHTWVEQPQVEARSFEHT